MTPSLKKRFWNEVTLREVEGGFTIFLDSHSLRTPAKGHFIVPHQKIGQMVRDEWDAVEETVDPAAMPATRASNVAIDKMEISRDAVIDMLAEYGGTDLLSYRAIQPEKLLQRQVAAWDPILDWARDDLKAQLNTTKGVLPVDQPQDSLSNLRSCLTEFNNFGLAGVHDLVTISGSLVLALAVTKKRLTAAEAWDISRIDETFQAEEWGEDEQAVEAAEIKRDAFLFAESFLEASYG